MVTKSQETVSGTDSPLKGGANYVRLEEKSYKTHPEALAKVEEWRKQHKIPKKDTIDNLHRVRIKLRADGRFDAVLYQKKLERPVADKGKTGG